jgi:hypothetical protein
MLLTPKSTNGVRDDPVPDIGVAVFGSTSRSNRKRLYGRRLRSAPFF